LEEHGVVLVKRNVSDTPLSQDELEAILGYQNPKHYLNSASSAFKKNKMDKKIPARNELIELIIEQPDLLRYPIITSGRLMTIGGNRQQLIDMFQLTVSDNGSGAKKGKSTTEGNK
jgi:arsenate reductase-like glutaredoxin family protein